MVSPGATGWSWDAATIRRYVGQGDVVDLLATRIAALPANAQALLEIVACLGGEVKYDLLQAASGLSTATLEEQLGAPLDDGLLVMEQGGNPSVRFRHDRVQQAAYGRLKPAARSVLHLTLARRLAASPALEVAAGEQYLSAVDLVEDPGERRRVAELFRGAAANARLVNYPLAERCLRGAVTLLGPVQTPADAPLLVALETELHAALYSLARLDEADEVYRSIERRCADTLSLADAACVQISSITNRGLPRQAVDLGLALLARLGLEIPEGDFGAVVARRLDGFYDWIAAIRPDDSQRPETDDPRVRTAAKLIDRLLAPAHFSDPMINSWLVRHRRRDPGRHSPPNLRSVLHHQGRRPRDRSGTGDCARHRRYPSRRQPQPSTPPSAVARRSISGCASTVPFAPQVTTRWRPWALSRRGHPVHEVEREIDVEGLRELSPFLGACEDSAKRTPSRLDEDVEELLAKRRVELSLDDQAAKQLFRGCVH